jgi:hypothetical protein
MIDASSNKSNSLQLELRRAVDFAYQAFGKNRVSLPLRLKSYSYDYERPINASTEALLCSLPVKKIPSYLLAEYTNALIDTPVELFFDQFKFFLPRYLDLIATDDPPDDLHGLCFCLRHLGRLKWRNTFSSVETTALDEFFFQFVKKKTNDIINRANSEKFTELALCDLVVFMVTSGSEINSILNYWADMADLDGATLIALLRKLVFNESGVYSFRSRYLEGYDSVKKMIGQFAMQPHFDEKIEVSFYQTQNLLIQQVLSDALWPK